MKIVVLCYISASEIWSESDLIKEGDNCISLLYLINFIPINSSTSYLFLLCTTVRACVCATGLEIKQNDPLTFRGEKKYCIVSSFGLILKACLYFTTHVTHKMPQQIKCSLA